MTSVEAGKATTQTKVPPIETQGNKLRKTPNAPKPGEQRPAAAWGTEWAVQ